MRKTLSVIVLALSFAVAGLPGIAFADDIAGGTPLPTCTPEMTAGTPCSPAPLTPCSSATAGQPCAPDPCQTALNTSRDQLARDQVVINRQQHRLSRQAQIIKRLRHRLAAR